jgi:hypothetical protein
MTYREHGHRGMYSISLAIVERDKKVPDTVEEDHDPRDFEGASLHRGHFRTWEPPSAVRPSTRCAAIVQQLNGTLKLM